MVNRSHQLRGFTAVELQVVVMVVAALAALMVPAVSTTREAARKSQCQDNFHNLAIALHSYEGVYKTLPPGWVHQAPQRSNYGWGTSLLPFVEQRALYDRIQMGHPAFAVALADKSRRQFFQLQIPLSRCPSDTGDQLNADRPVLDRDDVAQQVSLGNYVGVNGGGDWTRGEELRGCFGENSRTRIASITDGTSNTLLLGERSTILPTRGEQPVSCKAAIVYGVGGDGRQVNEDDTLVNGLYRINSGTEIPESKARQCSIGLASLHAGGVQACLGDAKVTFLSEDIDHDMLQRLMDKADGQPVRVP